ncbi:hypothetical protein EsH8_XII_000096 [Colletotrichum jinshuiense]
MRYKTSTLTQRAASTATLSRLPLIEAIKRLYSFFSTKKQTLTYRAATTATLSTLPLKEAIKRLYSFFSTKEQTSTYRAVVEEGVVVLLALVGTIHVEELLILVELEGDLGRVRVAVAVALGENPFSLLLLVVDEEPAGGLGEEHTEDVDKAGEEGLHLGDESPGGVAVDLKGATGRAGGDDGVRELEGVIHGTDDTAVGGVVDLDDVYRTGGGGDRDAATKEEAAAYKLAGAVGGALDAGPDDNDGGSNEHADAAALRVETRADEGKGDDTTDLVDGGDNTSLDAVVLGAVTLLKGGVLEQVVGEGAIVSVYSGAEETDEGEGEGVDQDLGPGLSGGRLLDHGLVEGLGAGDDLGLDLLL